MQREQAQAPSGGFSGEPGDLTDDLVGTSIWTDERLAAAGIPIIDTEFVSVGGGIGSFVLYDILRVAGIDPQRIRIVSDIERPWETYEYLTKVSQIPRPERLRSDSSGMPDNPWGFPSYAIRESRKEKTLAPLFSVTVEPLFTDYWTPRAGTVFAGMEKEAKRIRWAEVVLRGRVRMVRRRAGGGYFTLFSPPAGTSATRRVVLRSRFVHVAVGYPGLRFLPDLQEYRQKHDDYTHLVNAYEPHEHVYETLKKRGGVVLVRGGGIVASRVLQRLMEDRWNHGAQTTILHLFRTFVAGDHGPSPTVRRRGGNGWAFQGFNWPKGAWGGQLRESFAKLEGDERAALYKKLGGTHTPRRKLWQIQMNRARREGWYHLLHGTVQYAYPHANQIVSEIKSDDGSLVAPVPADFVIDATGLEGDLRDHRIFADLLDHSGATRNPVGRLNVGQNFEVRGSDNGGRMYASGSMTLGAYYAGVDSFLGLQFAAYKIQEDLAKQGFGSRIGPLRSTNQWWKLVRNRTI